MSIKMTTPSLEELTARQLLIGLLRSEHGRDLRFPDEIAQIGEPAKLLADEVNWTTLMNLARLEGLEAFLARISMKAGWAPFMSPEILRYLSERYLLNQILTRECISEFRILSKKFQLAGIDVIPIKGIALIQTLYRETGDRSFNDMDILVRKDSIDIAAGILSQEGYVRDPFRSRFGAMTSLFLNHHLPPFRKGRMTIELHYKLLPGDSDRFTGSFLSSAQRSPIPDSIKFPERIHHALFLAAHLDKHASSGQNQLRLIRDFAWLLGNEEEGWNQGAELAEEFELRPAFDSVRSIYRDIYVLDSPKYLKQIRMNKSMGLKTSLIKSLSKLPGWRLKMQWIADILFPTSQYVRTYHPHCKGFKLTQWYILRIFRGLQLLFTR